MNDKQFRKIIRGHWLGAKEKKILRESWPWPRVNEPSGIDISVTVGPPYEAPDNLSEDFQKQYLNRNKLRIDAVVTVGNRRIITEVTPSVGAGSTGKISLYLDLYSQDFGVSEENLIPCLLGREYHASVEGYCERRGIWLGMVGEGGPLRWVVKGG